MKYKFEDLVKVFKKLEQHSKKGDIEVCVDVRTHSLTFNYNSNKDSETTIEIYPSELNKFVTVKEEVWLS